MDIITLHVFSRSFPPSISEASKSSRYLCLCVDGIHLILDIFKFNAQISIVTSSLNIKIVVFEPRREQNTYVFVCRGVVNSFKPEYRSLFHLNTSANDNSPKENESRYFQYYLRNKLKLKRLVVPKSIANTI